MPTSLFSIRAGLTRSTLFLLGCCIVSQACNGFQSEASPNDRNQSVTPSVVERAVEPNPEKSPCDDCDSFDIPSLRRELLVVVDFQAPASEPCPPAKSTVAALQQWAMFDLLDMVQSDVRFGSVFVTDQAHVFRGMDPVGLSTERANIRRKLMIAKPKSGGKISEGLASGLKLLRQVPAATDRRLSLVLLLSRFPSDTDEIKKHIALINETVPTDIHIVATGVSAPVEQQLEEWAPLVPATLVGAQSERELANALLPVSQQLGVFDQSLLSELSSLRDAITQCCQQKKALCKIIDNTKAPTCDYQEVLALILKESKRLEERLILIEKKISNIHNGTNPGDVKIDFAPLLSEIQKLIMDLEQRISLSIKDMGDRLDDHLTLIEKKVSTVETSITTIGQKIDGIKIEVNPGPQPPPGPPSGPTLVEIVDRVYKSLVGWFWLLLCLGLIIICLLVFIASISHGTHKHVRHPGKPPKGSKAGSEYRDQPPPKTAAY